MIDAHHHFWRYNAQEYSWITEDVLRRNFEPHDLQAAIRSAGIDGVISVQARETLQETEWLLNLAREADFIRGVVGWVPLAAPEIEEVLERFAGRDKLKAVRHGVQGKPQGFLENPDFNAGIAALKRFNLGYDLLITERQLAETIAFVDRHPNQVFVLDHIAKPRIKDANLEPWKTEISQLARRENVFCKVSGMVTEADRQHWTPNDLKPYFDVVLEAFGPARLMFGSDWPVCLAASDYGRWAHTVREWAAPLSQYEKNDLFQESARRAYHLS